MSGQTSFRRLLLTRILVFSIPILLLGVAVTFRKARSSLLETARQNLTESAVRKASLIEDSVNSLQTDLAIAAQTQALQVAELESSQAFLTQLQERLSGAKCLQLSEPSSNQVIASTCGTQPITSSEEFPWPDQLSPIKRDLFNRFVVNPEPTRRLPLIKNYSHLDLVISTPVYDLEGRLRYSLSLQALVQQMEVSDPWSLTGFTVVIDQNGTFLAHPIPDRVGRSIALEGDSDRFDDILRNTERGVRDVRHLFDFTGDRTEWLAGFSPSTITTFPDEQQTWTVLAVTDLDMALQGLQDITFTLLITTGGLIAAHVLAMLYTARDLARPIEKLGVYARDLQQSVFNHEAHTPKDFRVREINQLSNVLHGMVLSLEQRADELESAWQEAEAANKLKSDFLTTTSHELRTPLNAIIGCIQLVQDGYCDSREEELDLLYQANKAAKHLLDIINLLLDIRSIEEDKMRLFIEKHDLCQTIREVIGLQAVEIQRKNLVLIAPEMSVPVMVKVDASKLRQVMLNVVSNAVKFTDEGGIYIHLRLEYRHAPMLNGANGSQNGTAPVSDMEEPLHALPWVVVSVKDTGIGIAPDQQGSLFRPFAMADGSTTRKKEGTGLGLAISRNLINRMDGDIQLFSEGLDLGTTVEMALPIVEGAERLQAVISQIDDPSKDVTQLVVGANDA
ncbi:MAG: sensor histidine kinase [Kaiparowitsia implicata GSE-PSE-MK54-09C]|jgi:signal transduction histidine kinase|nr:sensor histidine kinase [Kaiparowitsia implicata GSE-PSE-MK54-09C]